MKAKTKIINKIGQKSLSKMVENRNKKNTLLKSEENIKEIMKERNERWYNSFAKYAAVMICIYSVNVVISIEKKTFF